LFGRSGAMIDYSASLKSNRAMTKLPFKELESRPS